MQTGPVPPSASLSAPATPAAPADLQKAAAGFEEMFLVFLMRAGRAAGVGDQVAGSAAVDATRDMLDAHLARTGAARSHLGMADAVVRQFTRPERG